MRHVDVRRCAFGALGLWFLAQFKETNEMNEYNFQDNESWFKSKLMVSPQFRKKIDCRVTLKKKFSFKC